MEYDKDEVDEMVLAVLFLTTFESQYEARVWNGHDWDALDQLHTKGFISDPKGRAKSVMVTEEGLRQSRELFAKHFGNRPAADQQ